MDPATTLLRDFMMPDLSAIPSSIMNLLLRLTIFKSTRRSSSYFNKTNLEDTHWRILITTLLLSRRSMKRSRWMGLQRRHPIKAISFLLEGQGWALAFEPKCQFIHYLGWSLQGVLVQVFPSWEDRQTPEWHHLLLSIRRWVSLWSMGAVQRAPTGVPLSWHPGLVVGANIL